jgi:hypothetical protein
MIGGVAWLPSCGYATHHRATVTSTRSALYSGVVSPDRVRCRSRRDRKLPQNPANSIRQPVRNSMRNLFATAAARGSVACTGIFRSRYAPSARPRPSRASISADPTTHFRAAGQGLCPRGPGAGFPRFSLPPLRGLHCKPGDTPPGRSGPLAPPRAKLRVVHGPHRGPVVAASEHAGARS